MPEGVSDGEGAFGTRWGHMLISTIIAGHAHRVPRRQRFLQAVDAPPVRAQRRGLHRGDCPEQPPGGARFGAPGGDRGTVRQVEETCEAVRRVHV